MNKFVRERVLWLVSAFAFLILSSVLGYVVSSLEAAKLSLHELKSNQEADKIQWRKISSLRDDLTEHKIKQAEINGYNRAWIEILRMGMGR